MDQQYQQKILVILLMIGMGILMGCFIAYGQVTTQLYSGLIKKEEAMSKFSLIVIVGAVAGIILVVGGVIASYANKIRTKTIQAEELQRPCHQIVFDNYDGTDAEYLIKTTGPARTVSVPAIMATIIENSITFRGLEGFHTTHRTRVQIDASDLFRQQVTTEHMTKEERQAVEDVKAAIDATNTAIAQPVTTLDVIINKKDIAEKVVDVLGITKLIELTESKQIYMSYQPVEDVLLLDHPEYGFNGDERVSHCTGIYYLTPLPHDQYFKTQLRESPSRRIYNLNKSYAHMRFVCNLLENNFPLLVDRALLENRVITSAIIMAAQILAYQDFTLYASKIGEIFTNQLRTAKAENRVLANQQDESVADKLDKLLGNGEMDARIIRRLKMKTINMTGIVLLGVGLFIGILIAKVFFHV
jgi:hypothetical protein